MEHLNPHLASWFKLIEKESLNIMSWNLASHFAYKNIPITCNKNNSLAHITHLLGFKIG